MSEEEVEYTRELLVFGERNFTIRIPDDAKVTYGPWSPPSREPRENYGRGDLEKRGTLRIYKTEKNILALFSGVTHFRDTSLPYEEIAPEKLARKMVGLRDDGDEEKAAF